MSHRFRFAFISSNAVWGGSEELWSATAAALAGRGHHVSAAMAGLDEAEPRIRKLRALGCTVFDLGRVPGLPRRLGGRLNRTSWFKRLRLWLALRGRTDLAVLSQGINRAGASIGAILHGLGVPYVTVVHKAADLYWPNDAEREPLRQLYLNAQWCFFVSEHNWRLTEEQLALRLPCASVIRNPYLVPRSRRQDWPPQQDGVRLAMVGRFYPAEKGQDILLRVLARPKWRARPLRVAFYGNGPHRRTLEEFVTHLELDNIEFRGFVRDVAAIWSEHHALVLPSRCEGLPLVSVEAMMSGRVAITTAVGGAGEIIEDNVTGFLAASATEDDVDEAMERAWRQREKWQSIGAAAARHIRDLVPADPTATFADLLTDAATKLASQARADRSRLIDAAYLRS